MKKDACWLIAGKYPALLKTNFWPRMAKLTNQQIPFLKIILFHSLEKDKRTPEDQNLRQTLKRQKSPEEGILIILFVFARTRNNFEMNLWMVKLSSSLMNN